MEKLPQQSDTKRDVNNIRVYPRRNIDPQNNKSCFSKIAIAISIFVIVTVVVVAAAIVIKKFVLTDENKNCSDGFFKADDEDNKSLCYPCSLTNCKICEGKINDNVCKECKGGFNPEYNGKNEIILCGLTSSNSNIESNQENIECSENCIECDKVGKKCSKCESGYFVPDDSDNKLNCEKCSLNNCEKCEGTKKENVCTICKNNYFTKYNNDNIIKYCNDKCQSGDNEKCKECDLQNNECSSCNTGYYLPSDDDIKLECKSCSLSHCKICHGTKISNICDQCDENYDPVLDDSTIKECKLHEEEVVITCEKGEGSKCLTCSETEPSKCGSCNPSYKLVDGKCEFDKLTTTEKILETDKAIETEKKIVTDKIVETEKKIVTDKIIETEKKIITDKIIETEMKVETDKGVEGGKQNDDDELDYDYISLTAKYFSGSGSKSIQIIGSNKNQYIKKMEVDGVSKDPQSVSTLGIITFDDSKTEHTINFWLEITNDILKELFLSVKNLIYVKFNKEKNTNNVFPTLMNNIFCNCSSLELAELSNIDSSKVEDMRSIFYNNFKLTSVDLTNFNTQNSKDMGWFFYNTTSLKEIDLTSFDTSKVTRMKSMFYGTKALTSLNFGKKFNTGQVTDMSYMFARTNMDKLDLRHFDTRNVCDMQYMFFEARNLVSVDVSSFTTDKVANFLYIFQSCSSLTSLDLSNFNFIESDKHFTGPPMIFYCRSLRYIDIRSINFIYRDFFTGIPDVSDGYIRIGPRLRNNLLSMGIKVLVNWYWEVIYD